MDWAANGGGLRGSAGSAPPAPRERPRPAALVRYVEEGLAPFSVEQKNVARLRHLGNSIDRFTFASDRDEVRIDRQVMIPEIMP